MKRLSSSVFGLVILAIVPTALLAKGPTVKITIQGPGISTPIESTDTKLAAFNVWSGPGVQINGVDQTEGFIIDWGKGPMPEPAAALPRYEVSFYAGRPSELVYVVSYAFNAKTGQGFVYLPGGSLNMATMYRGNLEGHWFHATIAWDNFARQLLGRAQSEKPTESQDGRRQ